VSHDTLVMGTLTNVTQLVVQADRCPAIPPGAVREVLGIALLHLGLSALHRRVGIDLGNGFVLVLTAHTAAELAEQTQVQAPADIALSRNRKGATA